MWLRKWRWIIHSVWRSPEQKVSNNYRKILFTSVFTWLLPWRSILLLERLYLRSKIKGVAENTFAHNRSRKIQQFLFHLSIAVVKVTYFCFLYGAFVALIFLSCFGHLAFHFFLIMQFAEQVSRRPTREELGIIFHYLVPTTLLLCKFMSSKRCDDFEN